MKNVLSKDLVEKLTNLGLKMVNVKKNFQVIKPVEDKPGFWFGGGNILPVLNKEKTETEKIYVIGRFRDAGDSRHGVKKGRRGWKVSIFESDSFSEKSEFKEIFGLEKLDYVNSYEGATVFHKPDGSLGCLLSYERKCSYPKEVLEFQKAGTGIWEIQEFGLDFSNQKLVGKKNIIDSKDPLYLHHKDPVYTYFAEHGPTVIISTYSYAWSCGVSSYATMDDNLKVTKKVDEFFRGGLTWDVAVGRVTCRFPVPKLGAFANLPALSLYFYDSGECMKEHDGKKIKGHSCEEIAGLAYGFDSEFPKIHRISTLFPLFVSPTGTGCCRYIQAVENKATGELYVAWQQSNTNGAQPLVGNVVSKEEVEAILK